MSEHPEIMSNRELKLRLRNVEAVMFFRYPSALCVEAANLIEAQEKQIEELEADRDFWLHEAEQLQSIVNEENEL